MELFKVICVTCHAKLSVRNESLIGQIVGCPRCGSMVEVAPPPAESAPITASAESTINLPAQRTPESLAAEAAPEAAPEAAVEVAALTEATRAALEASAAVARYKVIVWSMASFFIGAAVVGVVVLRSGSTPDEVPAPAPVAAEATPVRSPEVSSTEAAAPPTSVEPAIEPTQPATVVSEVELPTAPANAEVIAAETPIEATQPRASLTTSDPPVVETQTIQVEPAPRLARKFDPLEFDPESLSLEAVDYPSETDDPANSEVVADVTEVDKELPAELPLVRRGPVDGDALSERDAAKQLNLVIPAVQLDQVPLVDCLRLFSQLGGVPVSVGPEHLMMAGITAKKRVSLDVSDTSLGDMLNQILEPLQLEFATQDQQVVIQRKDATKVREINYPVDDLVSADTSEEELAGWVEQLVAPGSWQASGGKGRLEAATGNLQISQTQQVQYQVLILLERLRLARGLPPRSRYPAKRLAGTPASELLAAELSKPTTFTFSQFTPLEEVFTYWQTELGLPLLVDWPALFDVGLAPQSTVACAIIEQPWQVALDKVLAPLQLGWRATTGGAIEITSAEKVKDDLQLEVIPIRAGANSHDLVAKLLSMTEKQGTEPTGALLYDSAGGALLSLQPATVQRMVHQHLHESSLLRD
ncbi:MAG: hypothetical protein ACR2NM_01305 [Bythopirellula sp.]